MTANGHPMHYDLPLLNAALTSHHQPRDLLSLPMAQNAMFSSKGG